MVDSSSEGDIEGFLEVKFDVMLENISDSLSEGKSDGLSKGAIDGKLECALGCLAESESYGELYGNLAGESGRDADIKFDIALGSDADGNIDRRCGDFRECILDGEEDGSLCSLANSKFVLMTLHSLPSMCALTLTSKT